MSRSPVFIPNFPSIDDLRVAVEEMKKRANLSQREICESISNNSVEKSHQCDLSRIIGSGKQRKKSKNVRYEEIRLLAEVLLENQLKEHDLSLSDIYGVLVERGRIVKIIKKSGETPPTDTFDKHPPRS